MSDDSTSEDDAPFDEGSDPGSKVSPAELLNRVRSGDTVAAYNLLGRQAPVKAWREALAYLAKDPGNADLEQAAHRALKRPPEVVLSLLDLAEAIGTPAAAFMARAVSSLRPEPRLVERATELRQRLLASFDLDLLLAADDGLGALYFVLAHDLQDQPQLIQTLAADATASRPLTEALDSEYQRLLELGRTVRWKSGSYRYFLRHALADLALLYGTRGRTGDLAYRLLQQQVENPQENEELLDLVPAETRRRFLNWALERDNALAYSARTRFVLSAAARHPKDIERSSVVAAARALSDPETSVAALRTAVELDPDASDLDRDIAERLAELPEEEARRLSRTLLDIEPRRFRLDLLSARAREIMIAAVDTQGDAIVSQVSELLTVTDLDTAQELIRLTEAIADRVPVADATFEAVARSLLTRAELDTRWDAALVPGALRVQRIRAAAWAIGPDFQPETRAPLVSRLIALESRDLATDRCAHLLSSLEEPDETTLAVLADAIIEGSLISSGLADAPERHLKALAELAEDQAVALETEANEAAALLESGQVAAERRLFEGLRPIVERAIDRAEGNPRLQDDYARLLPPPIEPTAAHQDEVSDEIRDSIVRELDSAGATVDMSKDPPTIRLLSSGDAKNNIRYLEILDQRLAKSKPDAQPTIRSMTEGYAEALGVTGDAARITTDLFARGPLMRLALGLSPVTRGFVVLAAIENGLAVEVSWLDDPQLGDWLANLTGEVAAPTSVKPAPRSPIEVLEEVGRKADAYRAARARLEKLQAEAKRAFVERTLPAFADLELAIDGYVQLWQALARLGVSQAAPLGTIVPREEIDPDRHDIVSSESGERYVVRSAGVAVDGDVVVKARLERDET